VFAVGSVGFPAGAAIADRVAQRIGLGRAIVLGGVVAAAALLLIAAPPAALAGPAIAAAMFIYGTGALVFTVSNITLRQLVTPPDMLGRVTSAMRLLTWIAQPVAGVLAAWLGMRIGLHGALWLGALGALTALIPLLTGRLARASTEGQRLPAPTRDRPGPPLAPASPSLRRPRSINRVRRYRTELTNGTCSRGSGSCESLSSFHHRG
jgi:MFS family permease